VWRSLLSHCTGSRKVEGSIPDGVIGNVIDIILPAVLGLTQPLTETNTRNISRRVKADGG
jgi:hypothetical protein